MYQFGDDTLQIKRSLFLSVCGMLADGGGGALGGPLGGRCALNRAGYLNIWAIGGLTKIIIMKSLKGRLVIQHYY